MSDGLGIEILRGADPAFARRLPDLARLRIEVFRDFPYLYDGSAEYEEAYLAKYLRCPDSVAVLALAEGKVVGASTGLPLEAEVPELVAPFLERGADPARFFYCGESVLAARWRGRGAYRRFFAAREEHARRLGRFDSVTLCAVERPSDHPLRPADYVPLDGTWERYGYVRRPDLAASFDWKDIDRPEPTAKRMVFWVKPL